MWVLLDSRSNQLFLDPLLRSCLFLLVGFFLSTRFLGVNISRGMHAWTLWSWMVGYGV